MGSNPTATASAQARPERSGRAFVLPVPGMDLAPGPAPRTMDAIEKALRHADQTVAVEVGRGALARVGDGVRSSLGRDHPVLIVADERTWATAGAAALASLEAAGVPTKAPLVFPGTLALYAAYQHCETVRERLRDTGALALAVGSGS